MQQEQHKPNFVLSVLTQIVHSMPAAEGQKLALDATLTKFQKAVGTCERMVKTPIPRSYTRSADLLGMTPCEWCSQEVASERGVKCKALATPHEWYSRKKQVMS